MNVNVKTLCEELFDEWCKLNPGKSPTYYMHSPYWWAAQKLQSLNHEVESLKFELETEQNKLMVWKESYLDQVKENVKMQAQQAVK
jgi:hypothetical protein